MGQLITNVQDSLNRLDAALAQPRYMVLLVVIILWLVV